ncbi:MAG TPA: glycosyltransferase family 1 protein, partial [Bacteroidota bacterium]|nr:glycosyltransferase family 1 protein [Bacteroidota bacterium]
SLSKLAKDARVDLFHEPHYTLPFGLRSSRVTTIADLTHLRFPEYFSAPKRLYASTIIRHACSASDAILTFSEFSKNDIVKEFRVSPDRIRVTYPGVSEEYRPLPSPERRMELRKKFGVRDRMILYVGNLKPHKNVPTLLRAVAALPNRDEYTLALVGEKMAENSAMLTEIKRLGITDLIVNPGRVSKDELTQYYQCADAVVLPSFYEGFGASQTEAMAFGVPVIGSCAASIPEVLGEAGLLFDPKSSEELTARIEMIFSDTSLRADLVRKGLERCRRYSWKACALETIAIYNQVAGASA